jgi:hypothetical protein
MEFRSSYERGRNRVIAWSAAGCLAITLAGDRVAQSAAVPEKNSSPPTLKQLDKRFEGILHDLQATVGKDAPSVHEEPSNGGERIVALYIHWDDRYQNFVLSHLVVSFRPGESLPYKTEFLYGVESSKYKEEEASQTKMVVSYDEKRHSYKFQAYMGRQAYQPEVISEGTPYKSLSYSIITGSIMNFIFTAEGVIDQIPKPHTPLKPVS